MDWQSGNLSPIFTIISQIHYRHLNKVRFSGTVEERLFFFTRVQVVSVAGRASVPVALGVSRAACVLDSARVAQVTVRTRGEAGLCLRLVGGRKLKLRHKQKKLREFNKKIK